MTRMAPLSEASMALPPAVIRNDAGVLLTMTRFLRAVLKTIPVSLGFGCVCAVCVCVCTDRH